MKRKLLRGALFIAGTLVLLFSFFYFFQEQLIFHPQKLAKDYVFDFPQAFEEINIPVDEQVSLNGLLFKAQNPEPEGLIVYLHGNAGSLASWGSVAKLIQRLTMMFLFMITADMAKAGVR